MAILAKSPTAPSNFWVNCCNTRLSLGVVPGGENSKRTPYSTSIIDMAALLDKVTLTDKCLGTGSYGSVFEVS